MEASKNYPAIPRGAMVLVCDGRKALFMRNHGSERIPTLVIEATVEQHNPATREQGADRPGRRKGGTGTMRSALDEGDAHAHAEVRFAAVVAHRLTSDPPGGAFEQLLLVAAPEMLGALRRELDPQLAPRIIGEISKVLTQHTGPEITRLLSTR
jgi:protein required for attachment to host cells